MFYIGLSMTVFYIILGIWLLLDPSFLPGVPRDFRNIFTAMVLIYGVFRGWRVWAVAYLPIQGQAEQPGRGWPHDLLLPQDGR